MESLQHHKKAEIAPDRPSYREARWERAVKVYTVNQESKYLLVQNVHALGVTQELLQLFALYGSIEEYRLLDDYPSEPFTDIYWIKFVDIDAARLAKKKLDNHSFFGKNLHVCYAPEYETVQDTREKLQQRREVIARRTVSKTTTRPSKLTTPTTSQPLPPPSSSGLTTHTSLSDGIETLPQHTSLFSNTQSHVSHMAQSHDSHMTQSQPLQSRDSHITQFAPLPTPPMSHCGPVQHYPSAVPEPLLQGKTVLGPSRSNPGSGMKHNTSSGMRQNPSSGMGQNPSSGTRHNPSSGMKQGHSSGMKQDFSSGTKQALGSGMGSGKEHNTFHVPGLSTEERVAAYLASEGAGGTEGESEGGQGGGRGRRQGGKERGMGAGKEGQGSKRTAIGGDVRSEKKRRRI